MNASQKVTAAAMALIITLVGAIAVTAPVTLSGFSPALVGRLQTSSIGARILPGPR